MVARGLDEPPPPPPPPLLAAVVQTLTELGPNPTAFDASPAAPFYSFNDGRYMRSAPGWWCLSCCDAVEIGSAMDDERGEAVSLRFTPPAQVHGGAPWRWELWLATDTKNRSMLTLADGADYPEPLLNVPSYYALRECRDALLHRAAARLGKPVAPRGVVGALLASLSASVRQAKPPSLPQPRVLVPPLYPRSAEDFAAGAEEHARAQARRANNPHAVDDGAGAFHVLAETPHASPRGGASPPPVAETAGGASSFEGESPPFSAADPPPPVRPLPVNRMMGYPPAQAGLAGTGRDGSTGRSLDPSEAFAAAAHRNAAQSAYEEHEAYARERERQEAYGAGGGSYRAGGNGCSTSGLAFGDQRGPSGSPGDGTAAAGGASPPRADGSSELSNVPGFVPYPLSYAPPSMDEQLDALRAHLPTRGSETLRAMLRSEGSVEGVLRKLDAEAAWDADAGFAEPAV